jgi:transposase
MRATDPDIETKWRQRVDAWRRSGQTAKQFAAQSGFSVSALTGWASRLRGGTNKEPSQAPKIVPLVRVAQPVAQSELVVELGCARVRVQSGFDPALLSAVVRVLKEAP